MTNSKKIEAELTIRCDVRVDPDVLKNVRESSDKLLADNDVATMILFAWLNPLLAGNEKNAAGYWDGVCEFKDRFSNLEITIP